jgi:hypothetical protein
VLVIGRREKVPVALHGHLHRGVAGEVMTSLIENPYSIQSDTVKATTIRSCIFATWVKRSMPGSIRSTSFRSRRGTWPRSGFFRGDFAAVSLKSRELLRQPPYPTGHHFAEMNGVADRMDAWRERADPQCHLIETCSLPVHAILSRVIFLKFWAA